jgi:hypothetical protein
MREEKEGADKESKSVSWKPLTSDPLPEMVYSRGQVAVQNNLKVNITNACSYSLTHSYHFDPSSTLATRRLNSIMSDTSIFWSPAPYHIIRYGSSHSALDSSHHIY